MFLMNIKKTNKSLLIVTGVVLVGFIAFLVYSSLQFQKTKKIEKPEATSLPTVSPTTEQTKPTVAPTLKPTERPSSLKDTVAPKILGVSGVSEGSVVTDPSRLIITVVAQDDRTESKDLFIRTRLDDAEWSDWSRQFRIYYGPLQDGKYTFSAQVKDLAGNTSAVYQVNFEVKNL